MVFATYVDRQGPDQPTSMQAFLGLHFPHMPQRNPPSHGADHKFIYGKIS